MRFKQLLFENQFEEVLDKYKMDMPSDKLLYRGYEEDINKWKVKKIRKDREPLDTPKVTQKFIDGVAEKLYPQVPLRSRSKFASTQRDEAEDYGTVYLCFPEQSANIVSFPHDSWRGYLGLLTGYFEDVYYDQDDIPFDKYHSGKDQKVYKFLELVLQVYKERMYYKIAELADLIDASGEFLRSYTQEPEYEYSAEGAVAKIIGTTKRYFEEMKWGISEDSTEIMFNGDSYILMDEEYFFDNFKWNGKRWEFKNEV